MTMPINRRPAWVPAPGIVPRKALSWSNISHLPGSIFLVVAVSETVIHLWLRYHCIRYFGFCNHFVAALSLIANISCFYASPTPAEPLVYHRALHPSPGAIQPYLPVPCPVSHGPS